VEEVDLTEIVIDIRSLPLLYFYMAIGFPVAFLCQDNIINMIPYTVSTSRIGPGDGSVFTSVIKHRSGAIKDVSPSVACVGISS